MGARADLTLVWDDRFRQYDFGPGHPFTEVPRQLGAELLVRWASETGVPLARVRTVPGATPEQLLRFHTRGYLRSVEHAGASGERTPLDQGDTPSFPGCDGAAARIVGGTIAAVGSVFVDGPRRAFQPGGGLHHSHPARASGFCIFNDIAVAIADVLARGVVRRVAYIDLDVHHGDGVMYGFYEDGRVLDIDFHQDGSTIFPGTGEPEETGRGDGAGLKVNVPLPPGAGDPEFAAIWDRVVPATLAQHRPELIVLQCGVDGHAGDPLGRLRYYAATYDRAIRSLLEESDRWAGGRLVVTGGGGYDPTHVARTLGMVGRRLAGGPPPAPAESLPSGWGAEFEALTGSDAPTVWEAVQGIPAPAPSIAEDVVGQLEHALGRKFP